LNIGLAVPGAWRNGELGSKARAHRFTFFFGFEVVGVAAAAAPDELFAFAGVGVVEPARKDSVARPHVGRRSTDVVDHANLAWTALIVTITAHPNALGGLLGRPIDTDFVRLAVAVTLALVTCAFIRDLDVFALCKAGVAIGDAVDSTDGRMDRRTYARRSTVSTLPAPDRAEHHER